MTRRRDIPRCAAEMGCLCAFHARGGSAKKPCNATEDPLEVVLASAQAHGEQSDPAHEAGDLADLLRLLAREAGVNAVRRACASYWRTHDSWSAS